MNILAIDTSCDETSASVTRGLRVFSNIIWSQAIQHTSFGGVMPSLAQRLHKERINWVINRALGIKHKNLKDIDAIAVTQGPGLAIALEVGIAKAKELAIKHGKPIIPINHIEAHLLSAFAKPFSVKTKEINNKILFPALGLVVSGGNTQFIYIEKIGKYKILAETVDDALGEALDKGARMLGLGYPGGAVLEKFAKYGNIYSYNLPHPLKEDKIKNRFSYSGLKTAMFRLVEKEKPLTKNKIYNLAASYQNTAFEHISSVLKYHLGKKFTSPPPKHLLLGGGVVNNIYFRSKLRKFLKPYNINVITPYTKKLCGDNAAMVGVCAYLNGKKTFVNKHSFLDRKPSIKI